METFGGWLTIIVLLVTWASLGVHVALRRKQLQAALSECDKGVARDFRHKVWRYCLSVYGAAAVLSLFTWAAVVLAWYMGVEGQMSLYPFWAGLVLQCALLTATMVNAIVVAVQGVTPVLDRMGFRRRRVSVQTGPLRHGVAMEKLPIE